MAKRRYVVELTKAQLDALINIACNGLETFSHDDYYKKVVAKGDEAITCLHDAQLNGLKTIKTKA